MKSSMINVLTSAAAFFALCATVAACGHGSYYSNSYQSYPSYSSYPSQYSTAPSQYPTAPPQHSTANTAPVGPVTSNLTSPVTPSAPQAHITVVPTTDAPAGNLQIASPGPSESANGTIHEVPSTESKATAKTDADASKALDATTAVKVETSKIADAIKGLVGTWMAVSRHGDGELSTVELQLDDSGWAKLTVPGADGKPSTTTRKVEFENNELKLTGADADVILGKLVAFNARQMVLERSGGQVTFVRP